MPTSKIIGVYTLTNNVTGRRYVGSSKDVMNRKASHFWQMRAQRHKNTLIQADFDQHGAESFEFEILYKAPYAFIRQIEQSFIDEGDFAYNLAPKATGGGAQNEHTSERMRKAQLGKTHTSETIAKLKARPPETNGGFIGYYITPKGTYPNAYLAADAMGGVLNFTTIRRWCRNPDKPICILSYRKSAYLQAIGESVIGQTPRDLGFGFVPAGSTV
jgi:group I intron endonuclease